MIDHADRAEHKRCNRTAVTLFRSMSYKLMRLKDMVNDKCPGVALLDIRDLDSLEKEIAKLRMLLQTR